MKKNILKLILEKIPEVFSKEKTSSGIASSFKVLSPAVAELSAKSISAVEQLYIEIARDATYHYVFETGKALTIPTGMICSNHAGENGEVGYITLARGNSKALSGGTTGGYSIRLPDQVEAATSGHRITVRVIARASGNDQSRFAVAYSTNEVGNSGWHWFNAGSEWSVYTIEYDVPVMKEGCGDFIGILPDSEENLGTDFCYFAITITKNVGIKRILQQKNSMKTIIVSSNCQTGGIAAALQEIFSKDKILAVPYSNHTDDQILEHLYNADIWISSDRFGIAQKCLVTHPKLVLYKIPRLHFTAFHPDLIYTVKISTNEIIKGPSDDYHSAICVWAFKNGLEAADTAALFTLAVFYELGYFSIWKSSVDNFSQSFRSCNLDASLFLPFIVRQGLFMYSINHPKVYVLIRMAKILAMKIGANESILEKDINIADGLTFNVWPVYPEIADFYALPGGSYDWKISIQKKICGLKEYIESCFNVYKEQGLERHDIKFHGRDESVYDRILGPIAGVGK